MQKTNWQVATRVTKMFILFDPRISIWRFYSKKLILKEKNEFCKDVYSCLKYHPWKLETAILERFTNLLKYCKCWEGTWSWDVAIMMEEEKSYAPIVSLTASKNSIQAWNGQQGHVKKGKLESNIHKSNKQYQICLLKP